MDRVTTHVYNGNVYVWVLLPGLKTHIVKVPLDGGKAQMFPLMPGHVTGDDPHRYYTIAADALGYIHVVGDMHSSAHVKHWVSKKPEDISEFVSTSDSDANKRPGGYKVTYPHFFRSPDGVLYHCIRCANPVWGICISVLDGKTQTWTVLGAEIPDGDLKNKHEKMAIGKPITASTTTIQPTTEGAAVNACRFHERCPIVRDKCKEAEPELEQVSGEREVRCFYWK